MSEARIRFGQYIAHVWRTHLATIRTEGYSSIEGIVLLNTI